jgi:hypothetical protein
LIDAEQLLAFFRELDTRLRVLESATPTNPIPPQGQVVITQLIPATEIRIEEELRILGSEFYFSRGAARVLINGVERPIKPQFSTDTELRIDIPPGTALGQATVRVTNSFTGADRTINILAAQVPLLGNPVVRFLSVNPTQIRTDSTVARVQTFFYQLDATGMSRLATFTVNPFISVSEWDTRANIVSEAGASRSNQFQLAPGQTATFGVAVDLRAATGNPTTFTTRIDVSSEGRVWQLADSSYFNGQTVLPSNPAIQLGTPDVLQAAGTFDDATNTITGQARLTLPVTFTAAGSYTPIVAALDGTSLSSHGWNRTPATIPVADITVPMLATGGGSFPVSLTQNLSPGAGAQTVEIEVGYGIATSRTVEHFRLVPGTA